MEPTVVFEKKASGRLRNNICGLLGLRIASSVAEMVVIGSRDLKRFDYYDHRWSQHVQTRVRTRPECKMLLQDQKVRRCVEHLNITTMATSLIAWKPARLLLVPVCFWLSWFHRRKPHNIWCALFYNGKCLTLVTDLHKSTLAEWKRINFTNTC